VSGKKYVGGLAGRNTGTVSNSYSTGSVSGSTDVGGLAGSNTGTITNSFWDNETSNQATSAGGTGKTTEEMKNVRTFTDVAWSDGLTAAWDFVGNPYDDAGNEDIWGINPDVNDGYPFLAEPAAPTVTPTPPPETPYAIYAGVISIVIVIVGLVAYFLIRRRRRSVDTIRR
jgi:hypothetical protein